jgi:hypothetical protein
MNYDDVVLGTENPNHPANECDNEETSLHDQILSLEFKLTMAEQRSQFRVGQLEDVIKHAIEVMESLPEDEQNTYLINKFKNVL